MLGLVLVDHFMGVALEEGVSKHGEEVEADLSSFGC